MNTKCSYLSTAVLTSLFAVSNVNANCIDEASAYIKAHLIAATEFTLEKETKKTKATRALYTCLAPSFPDITDTSMASKKNASSNLWGVYNQSVTLDSGGNQFLCDAEGSCPGSAQIDSGNPLYHEIQKLLSVDGESARKGDRLVVIPESVLKSHDYYNITNWPNFEKKIPKLNWRRSMQLQQNNLTQ